METGISFGGLSTGLPPVWPNHWECTAALIAGNLEGAAAWRFLSPESSDSQRLFVKAVGKTGRAEALAP